MPQPHKPLAVNRWGTALLAADTLWMAADGDSVEIGGVRVPGPAPAHQPDTRPRSVKTRFLSVWFRCCHTYGRMNLSVEQRRYEGRCPRCGASVCAGIGDHGTKRRVFEAT